MQQRHLDRYAYFNDLAVTSRDFYIGYLGKFIRLYPGEGLGIRLWRRRKLASVC